MLNWNDLIQYVKGMLSLPSTYIENNDEELKTWIKLKTFKEFSTYFPDWERTAVVTSNAALHKVDGKTNQFYFYDEESLPIINIKECYFPLENEIWSGHPIFGPTNVYNMETFAISVFKSKMFSKFSSFNRTYKFIRPNIVEVLPQADNMNFVVEYYREQPHDLSKIPYTSESYFMDLALANVMIQIGTMRSHYGQGQVTTGFGQIDLNGEQLKTDGKELKASIMESLKEDAIPPIYMEIF